MKTIASLRSFGFVLAALFAVAFASPASAATHWWDQFQGTWSGPEVVKAKLKGMGLPYTETSTTNQIFTFKNNVFGITDSVFGMYNGMTTFNGTSGTWVHNAGKTQASGKFSYKGGVFTATGTIRIAGTTAIPGGINATYSLKIRLVSGKLSITSSESITGGMMTGTTVTTSFLSKKHTK